MTTLLSHPVNLVVKAPVSADARFGEGSDAGQLDGDVWYPGRDQQGRVNAASWELVPRQKWVSISGTKLSSLDAQVLAAVPGWSTSSLAWEKLFQSWSGFALDLPSARLWFLGGGHSDGHNNGLYRFDLFRMKWVVEEMPSDRTLWSSNYNPLSATRYPDSDAAAATKQANGTLEAVNDIYWDELPDGKPTARHTYSSLLYIPDTQEVVMPARRLWRYSLNQKAWNYKRLIRDQYDQWMDAEDIIATFDEASGEILFSSCGSQAKYRATGYDLYKNSWTDWADSPWRRYYGVADVRKGRYLILIRPPFAASSNGSPQKGLYWRHDLDTRATVESGELAFSDGLTADAFSSTSSFYDGASCTYIESLQKYWLYTRSSSNVMQLFEVDPANSPWTIRRLDEYAVDPPPRRLLKRRMNYWPALNAVTLADNGDLDFKILRL